jgi:hypothetical protein
MALAISIKRVWKLCRLQRQILRAFWANRNPDLCTRDLAQWMHEGFWRFMDTLRDKQGLERLWLSGAPSWKRW